MKKAEHTKDWKEKAEKLFFICEKSIVEIADELSMSRKAIGDHLKTCAAFSIEKERRKRENADNRKSYQREWDRNNRRNYFPDTSEKEDLRREHDIAAMILSYERFYNEM